MRLKSKKTLIWLIIFLIVIYVLYYYYKRNAFLNIAYAVVIDAGSTGSRIHVFKLYKNSEKALNGTNKYLKFFCLKSSQFLLFLQGPNKFDVKLIKELLVIKIKPGLSSYANEPDKVK
jgi:Golgi nucleoside diphosphatase